MTIRPNKVRLTGRCKVESALATNTFGVEAIWEEVHPNFSDAPRLIRLEPQSRFGGKLLQI